MKMRKALFICILFITFQWNLKAQERPILPIDTVVSRVQGFSEVYPLEKLHLHFDKPYYAVGDTLWFNTFLAHNFLAYDPSKIAYVEILNSRDSLIQTLKIPLKSGTGSGYWVLDPSYVSQDNYRFRAYTKWMANFNQSYFFNKIIPIGDAINKKLSTHIEFEPKGTRTTAHITLRNAEGRLLSDQRVDWEATDGWDPFEKGKTKTDNSGKLSVSFNIKDEEHLKRGKLRIIVEGDKGEASQQSYFSLRNALWDADVQFFPEGGDLIAGISKKVGFKAIGIDGKGLNIKGEIKDKKNKTVLEFSDMGLGMGFVEFLPLANEKYKAYVRFENGEERTYELPEVKEEGMSLIVHQQDEDNLQIALLTNEVYFEQIKDQPFYVLAQLNNRLVYAARAMMKNSSVLINIPKAGLPNGIIQLTLMRPDGRLMSERLAFIHAEELLDIQVKSDKNKYTQKDKVDLSLKIANSSDTTKGNYSIAVIDESKVPFDDDQDLSIVSNFLLTSDLSGYVENANYYFNPDNENRKEALEALLLTQGHRKFAYENLLASKYPQIEFLPEQGINLSGILRSTSGRPVRDAGLLLTIREARLRKDVYTDASGRFAFLDLNFPDSSRVNINARGNANYRDLVINMDPTFFPDIDMGNPYASNSIPNLDENLKTYLGNSKKEFRTSILIDEVVVTGRVAPQVTSREFSALSGLSMPEHRIEGDRLSGCNDLAMCLNTLLTGITYDNQTLKYYVTRNYNQGSRVPAQIFLDGMPIDEHSLSSIRPEEVAAIELFLKDDLGTVSRLYQNDGVISIMTHKKEKKDEPRMSLAEIEAMLPKSNVIDMYPLGYIKERTFYTPKYETQESKNTNDYRTTIYWNSDVKTVGDEEVHLQFYNGDGNGKYKVVVEGMDELGNVGRKVYRYEVN